MQSETSSMSGVERTLAIVAAVLTIGNFIVALPTALRGSATEWLSANSHFALPTRLVVTVILELALSYFFGYLMARAATLPFPKLCLMFGVIPFPSAWMSAFNLEFLLIGRPVSGGWEWFGFALLMIIACAIGCAMHVVHIGEMEGKCTTDSEAAQIGAAVVQVIAFIIVFITVFCSPQESSSSAPESTSVPTKHAYCQMENGAAQVSPSAFKEMPHNKRFNRSCGSRRFSFEANTPQPG